MGDVIVFAACRRPRGAPTSLSSDCATVLAAASRPGADRNSVVTAAAPLLARLSLTGFAVMRRGLPPDPRGLADALLLLASAVDLLGPRLRRPSSSIGVYFGKAGLAWFEDGYGGDSGLAVPVATPAPMLADIIRRRFGA